MKNNAKNGQSATKLLNSNEQAERSETIPKGSRDENSEKEELRIFRFYILIDPRNNDVRYIGRTCQSLKVRLRTHISESLNNKNKNKNCTKKENWICKLNNFSLKPLIKEVYSDTMTLKQSYVKEKELILEYLYKHDLTNSDDHGINLFIGNGSSKKVYQYDLQGNFIKEWSNANVVYNEIGIKDSNIGRCASNSKGFRTAGDFYWSYEKLSKYPIREKIKCTKKVFKYDLNNNLIESYESLLEASKKNSINNKILSSKILKNKTINGFKYSYQDIVQSI